MAKKLLGLNMTLLIVEDLKEYAESMAFISEDYFSTIRTVATLDEAKKAFKEEVPDVAIIDIRLSEEDDNNKEGIQLLKWIKANSYKTSVIVISAYRDFDYAVEALNAGAEYFLKKPVKHSELEGIIAKFANAG